MEVENQRLREFRKHLGKTQGAFAIDLQLKQGSLSDIERGKVKVSGQLVKELITKYRINPLWLYGESDTMFLQQEQDLSISPILDDIIAYERPSSFMPKLVTVDSSGKDNISLVPVKARAGYLAGYEDEKFIRTLPAFWLPQFNNGMFRCFEIEGHSMFPTLKDGDYIIGEYIESLDHVRDDRVHIVVTKSDGIVVKRVINRSKKLGKLLLKSDNRREYPNISVRPDDILEIWHAKAFLSYQLPDPIELFNRVADLEAEIGILRDELKGSKHLLINR